jgi:hypothetical protein
MVVGTPMQNTTYARGTPLREFETPTPGVWSAKTQAPKRAEGSEPRGRTLCFRDSGGYTSREKGV